MQLVDATREIAATYVDACGPCRNDPPGTPTEEPPATTTRDPSAPTDAPTDEPTDEPTDAPTDEPTENLCGTVWNVHNHDLGGTCSSLSHTLKAANHLAGMTLVDAAKKIARQHEYCSPCRNGPPSSPR